MSQPAVVNVPLKKTGAPKKPPADSRKAIKAMVQHVNDLCQLYQTQQKELTYLTQDTGKVESFAMIEHLTAKSDNTLEEITTLQKSISDLMAQTTQLDQAMTAVQSNIDQSKTNLDKKESSLSSSDQDIKNLLVTAATRDRMLQLSQERNIYKKKIIYVLLAIIIALITVILASYRFFSTK